MTKQVVNIAVLLLLGGCAKAPERTEHGGVLISDGNGSAVAYPITMPDGTRCVALVGYSKAGIDCDFRDQEVGR